MPHFLIDCAESVLERLPAEELLNRVHRAALASELFRPQDVKVRVRAYREFTVGDAANEFVHVFANIMAGRTVKQRAALSRSVVSELAGALPDVTTISMNVSEFEAETYCNRAML